MKTKKVAELADNLPTKEKLSILELIDFKVESDMEKVINKIESLDNRINGLHSKMTTVLWVIGIGFTLMGSFITILKFIE